MLTKKLVCLAASIVAVATATSASAATKIYTDQAAFNAASTATQTNFNFNLGSYTGQSGGSYTQNGLTFASSPSTILFEIPANQIVHPVDFLSYQGGFAGTGTISGPYSAIGLTYASYTGQPTSVTFSGSDFTSHLELPNNQNGDATGFFGAISDGQLGPISLSYSTNAFDIVNFSVGQSVTAAVPEPTTWALMLVGFGLIGFAIRKRSNVRTTVSYA